MDQAVKSSSNGERRPRKPRKRRIYTNEELEERKRRYKIQRTSYRQTMVGLSSAYVAWQAQKAKGHWSHGEMALHLLDIHSKFCTRPSCVSPSEVYRDDAMSNEAVESENDHDSDERVNESSDKTAPDHNTSAKILASFRPIRSKEEFVAQRASVNTRKDATTQTESITNEHDLSQVKKNAASKSVEVVVPEQEDVTETCEEEQKEEVGEEDDRDTDRDVTLEEFKIKEPTNVDDFLNFQENLEPEETDIKEDDNADFERHEDGSSWGEGLDHEMTFNDGEDEDEDGYSSEEEIGQNEKRQRLDHEATDLPFRRFDVAEVARAEGVQSTGGDKISIKRVYWTEMERIYRCSICLFEGSNAYIASRHLLQEHSEVVGDLTDYLKKKRAPNSETDRTLYDMVMEFSPSDDSADGTKEKSISCNEIGQEIEGQGQKIGEQEMQKQEIGERGQEVGSSKIPEEESETRESNTNNSSAVEKRIDPLDTSESVELLQKWVKLHISCQFCQLNYKFRLYTENGNRTTHRCRSTERIPALCDVCGKSLSYFHLKRHWADTHCKPEQVICPYCGKMVRASRLTTHIYCHTNRRDQYQCGICGKGFKSKKGKDAHQVIHLKEKPFKCSYCQRGFTQASNMRYHMRQHTGERPYQCNKCSECFAHNVSLKNHLKSKHGIDPWKTGSAGD